MNNAQTSILLSGNERIYLNAENPGLTDARLWTQPENIPEWGATHDKVRFDLYVVSAGGSPTTWSLGVKFQVLLPHTTGVNWQNPTWVDLDTVGVASDITEGLAWSQTQRSGDAGAAPQAGGFGVVATDVTTLPFAIKRTIKNFGLACRVKLDPFATGGTNPYLKIALQATRSCS